MFRASSTVSCHLLQSKLHIGSSKVWLSWSFGDAIGHLWHRLWKSFQFMLEPSDLHTSAFWGLLFSQLVTLSPLTYQLPAKHIRVIYWHRHSPSPPNILTGSTLAQVIRHYHGHLSGVYALKLHPTLDILMTGGRDSVCRVWDMRSKVQIHALSGHDDTVCSIISQSTDPQVWLTSYTLRSREHPACSWTIRDFDLSKISELYALWANWGCLDSLLMSMQNDWEWRHKLEGGIKLMDTLHLWEARAYPLM